MSANKTTIKFYLTLSLVLWSLNSFAQYDSIQFDGYDRTYLLHLPADYTGETSIPMIIAMHGGFGNAYNIEDQSQLSVKADSENFIVVYPEGIKGGVLNVSSWNAGWCCGYASTSKVDDVGFIEALLDTLINQYAIDTNRIYSTGMSNGGFMSYRLACELSDRIAAIAPVAASISMNSCHPTRPVPIIDFHSYLDSSVPYDGGIGDGPSDHYNTPKDSILNMWSAMDSCAILNDTVIDNSQYTLIKWSSCNCGAEIHHYATQDGGHSWPGADQTLFGDPPSKYINATDLMWSFFQQYSLDCDSSTDINETSIESNNIKVFPNPTNGKLEFHSEIDFKELEISIFTLLGEKILTIKNETKIDISHFINGNYIVQIKIDGKIKTDKIVKL